MAPETQPQMVARLLKSGGYFLLVGGNLEDQLSDRYKKHSQVILWDDVRQGTEHKQVPSNTRAIAYTRYVSHAMSHRLRDVAKQLQCPVFPMLKPREVRELLSEIVPPEPVPSEPVEMIPVDVTAEEPAVPPIQTKESLLRKPRRGEYNTIFQQELLETETPGQGATRLLPILQEKYGITASEDAIAQAIRKYRTDVKAGNVRPSVAASLRKRPEPMKTEDAFSEGERLLHDALTAIQLFLEFIPKLRAERQETQEKMDRVKKILGE